MNPVQRYVGLCAEVLAHSREAARAAQESRWEELLAHLLAREAAMGELGRLPQFSPSEVDLLRSQALPLLQEAARLNEQTARRVRRVRDRLGAVVASPDCRFLDVYR